MHPKQSLQNSHTNFQLNSTLCWPRRLMLQIRTDTAEAWENTAAGDEATACVV